MKDLFCFRSIGIFFQKHHQTFRAGNGTGHAGLAVLVDQKHLDQLHPGRCLVSKKCFGKNFFLQDFRVPRPAYAVDTVVVTVIMQHKWTKLRTSDAVGHISPAERCFGGNGARFRVNLLPNLTGKMPHHFLNERIITIVIDTLAPRQELIKTIGIVSICKRHGNLLR